MDIDHPMDKIGRNAQPRQKSRKDHELRGFRTTNGEDCLAECFASRLTLSGDHHRRDVRALCSLQSEGIGSIADHSGDRGI